MSKLDPLRGYKAALPHLRAARAAYRAAMGLPPEQPQPSREDSSNVR